MKAPESKNPRMKAPESKNPRMKAPEPSYPILKTSKFRNLKLVQFLSPFFFSTSHPTTLAVTL